MAYIGSTPTTQSFISGTDYFNGTGSQTAFTLTRTVNSVNDIQVVVNNVVQQPNDAYTLSGTTLTFTSAPSSGTNNVYVRYLSTTTQSIAPSQNSVGWNQLDTNTQQDLGISFKNRIINGDMRIDQRNSGASVSRTGVSNAYTLDRWNTRADSDGVFSVQRIADAPSGFINSLRVTVTTADSSIGAAQVFGVSQSIEGFNVADLGFGTANAKTVTVSFWVKSSLTGSFGGSLSNGASNRSYPFLYTISSANTWEYKTITIAGDTTGTWATDNAEGLRLNFAIGIGSNELGTANAWASGLFRGTSGQTQIISTLNATWQLTGVQLEVGTQATAFDNRAYGTELALCQRYYTVIDFGTAAGLNGFADSSTSFISYYYMPVEMRSAPTLVTTGTASNYQIRYTGANTTTCNAVPTISNPSKNISRINATVASGLTGGQGGALTSTTSSVYLGLNSEL